MAGYQNCQMKSESEGCVSRGNCYRRENGPVYRWYSGHQDVERGNQVSMLSSMLTSLDKEDIKTAMQDREAWRAIKLRKFAYFAGI